MTTEDYSATRARLLAILQKDGILHASETQPIRSVDGRKGRWILDTLSVSMTPEGLDLAGKCLLHKLESFSGHTIATLGTTAIPLVSSVIVQSGGKYKGLLVRKERKPYGASKLIEGPMDKHEPVIVIDDSISSGRAMSECIQKLEGEGFRVEGGIVLVHFGFQTGFGRLQGKGYHLEAVYDIWADFMHYMDNEPNIETNPTKRFPEIRHAKRAIEDGLHPATCAREMIRCLLETGKLPTAPKRLDRDHDARGGVWVSLRNPKNIHQRHAREGFWHFPDETPGTTVDDLALACLKTVQKLPKGVEGLRLLEESAIAVTFFSPLEACDVGDLDNDRYGIVVCSKVRPGVMGGALPRMPNIPNTWRQFQHARIKNAKLFPHEPFQTYRHELTKHIEPGQGWQSTGVPLPDGAHPRDDEESRVTARALDLVQATLEDREPSTEPLPADLLERDMLFVSIYADGRLVGCMGGGFSELDADLARICRQSLSDPRFAAQRKEGLENLAVSVSFLDRTIEMGTMPPERVTYWFTFGYESLQVYQGDRSALMLSSVPCYLNLNPNQFVTELIDKAGITRPPYHWRKFRTRSWLTSPDREPVLLEGVFPRELVTSADIKGMATAVSGYLLRMADEKEGLYFRYQPCQDTLFVQFDSVRLAHGAWVTARAGRQWGREDLTEVSTNIQKILAGRLGHHNGQLWLHGANTLGMAAETAFLLAAICESDVSRSQAAAERLTATLWSRICRHGKVHLFRQKREDEEKYQDYGPGQVLLALAIAEAHGLGEQGGEDRREKLARALDFYRHRFRHKRGFGQVSWMMQAFARWSALTDSEEAAAFVYEIGDWVITYQDKRRGCFYNDHQADTPGFTTALYLEGLGAGMNLAAKRGDKAREARYREAMEAGFRFMDRLVISERDAPVLPNPEWAEGGVRQSLHASEVRTDFVQHTLSALLEMLPEGPEKTDPQ